MNRSAIGATVLAAGAVIVSLHASSSAGPLDPPPGPVSPTGATLSDISAALTGVPEESWEVAAGNTEALAVGASIVLTGGSGTIHAVWMDCLSSTAGSVAQTDGKIIAPEPVTTTKSNTANPSGFLALNARYTSGLQIQLESGNATIVSYVVLYKPD